MITEATKPGEKPKDTNTVITRVPKVALFVLKKDENTKYEELLEKIYKGECESITSSGVWHDGEYRIQAHYYEITKKEEQRKDTDFETNIDEETQEKDKQKEKDKNPVVIRDDVVKFESSVIEIEDRDDLGNEKTQVKKSKEKKSVIKSKVTQKKSK